MVLLFTVLPTNAYLRQKFRQMKSVGKTILISLILTLAACGGDAPNSDTPTNDTDSLATSEAPADVAPSKPNCQYSGNVLEGNEFWASLENLIVVITASKETEDPDLGESHRILELYDGNNCEQVFKQILPVNLSADFPYYLSKITYNKVSKLIAIRGFDKFYVFDLGEKKLTGPLAPKFLNQRYVEDASSGAISHLEVWERYLIGYAANMGPFVYDLREPAKPAPVLPFAEYEIERGTYYNSLFLLKSLDEADGHQALLPTYDADTGEFQINPLFDSPLQIELNVPKTFRNNRYLVLKELTGGPKSSPIAIDMGKMKRLDLPADIAAKKDTEIIEWMKKQ